MSLADEAKDHVKGRGKANNQIDRLIDSHPEWEEEIFEALNDLGLTAKAIKDALRARGYDDWGLKITYAYRNNQLDDYPYPYEPGDDS